MTEKFQCLRTLVEWVGDRMVPPQSDYRSIYPPVSSWFVRYPLSSTLSSSNETCPHCSAHQDHTRDCLHVRVRWIAFVFDLWICTPSDFDMPRHSFRFRYLLDLKDLPIIIIYIFFLLRILVAIGPYSLDRVKTTTTANILGSQKERDVYLSLFSHFHVGTSCLWRLFHQPLKYYHRISKGSYLFTRNIFKVCILITLERSSAVRLGTRPFEYAQLCFFKSAR